MKIFLLRDDVSTELRIQMFLDLGIVLLGPVLVDAGSHALRQRSVEMTPPSAEELRCGDQHELVESLVVKAGLELGYDFLGKDVFVLFAGPGLRIGLVTPMRRRIVDFTLAAGAQINFVLADLVVVERIHARYRTDVFT